MSSMHIFSLNGTLPRPIASIFGPEIYIKIKIFVTNGGSRFLHGIKAYLMNSKNKPGVPNAFYIIYYY